MPRRYYPIHAPASNNGGINLGFHQSTFRSANGIHLNITQNQPNDQNSITILAREVAFGALYNSAERFDPPKCHPHTRVAVLEHLHRWAKGSTGEPSPIIWLRGAAGAGKSAIAQTLAERWDTENLLAGCFFFSRTAYQRNEKKYLIPTLVYQLCSSIPEARSHILDAIEEPVFRKDLRTQLDTLIITPLKKAAEQGGITNRIVIIDGLDECSVDYSYQDHEKQQAEILRVITIGILRHGLPLRFLIASRPERQIRESFEFSQLKTLSSLIPLHQTPESDADIELYLRCEFGAIRNRSNLPMSWPGNYIISKLVQISSGHFVYAATAIRFIRSPRADPQQSLNAVLAIEPSHFIRGNPLAQLDALYLYILNYVIPESLPTVWLVFFMLTEGPLEGIPCQTSWNSIIAFSDHLLMSTSQLEVHLTDLHSILHIPEDPAATQLRFIHASFTDFLTNPQRSGRFCIKMRRTELLLGVRLHHFWATHLGFSNRADYLEQTTGYNLLQDLQQCSIASQEVRLGLECILNPNQDAIRQYLAFIRRPDFWTSQSSNSFETGLPLIPLHPFDRVMVDSYLQRCHLILDNANTVIRTSQEIAGVLMNESYYSDSNFAVGITERPGHRVDRAVFNTHHSFQPSYPSQLPQLAEQISPHTHYPPHHIPDTTPVRYPPIHCSFGCLEFQSLPHVLFACPRFRSIRDHGHAAIRQAIDVTLVFYGTNLGNHPGLCHLIESTFKDDCSWTQTNWGMSLDLNGVLYGLHILLDTQFLTHLNDHELKYIHRQIGREWQAGAMRIVELIGSQV